MQDFLNSLAQKGLLNPNTGTRLVRGIDGEDRLLAKWRAAAPEGVDVQMGVERLSFGESRCWPVFA